MGWLYISVGATACCRGVIVEKFVRDNNRHAGLCAPKSINSSFMV